MLLSGNDYELQATACLKAAEQHRETLQSSAVMLAGDDEKGRELYQEAVLRAHDCIQAHGFHGEGYQFYIWRIIKNLHKEQHAAATKQRPLRLDELEQQALDEQSTPQTQDALALADQICFELEQRYSPADVAAFKLHVNGQSCRDIEQLTGRNYRTISRTIKAMKQQLASLFRPAYSGIE